MSARSHARGYGWADLASRRPVQATSLFRIASISKPITATAVLQFVERGALQLDTPVWRLLGLTKPADARWRQVTVLHLLPHSGGWDRQRSCPVDLTSVWCSSGCWRRWASAACAWAGLLRHNASMTK